jgi:hypothetical protein
VNWRLFTFLCLALSLTGCLKEQARRLAQCAAIYEAANSGRPVYERGHPIRECMLAFGYDFNPDYDFCRPDRLNSEDVNPLCYRPIGATDRYFTNKEISFTWWH